MSVKTSLPVGVENFQEIRTMGLYYVDKTGFIKALLDNWGKVKLFTRPRRFGKTLNMSMLKYFFEFGCDQKLFEGLEISKEKELCAEYMGKFPVISISLKDISGNNFSSACEKMCSLIGNEAMRFSFLSESDRLTETEREKYRKLTALDNNGMFALPNGLLRESLFTLSLLLEKHYGKKAIILIDEYDVPLDQAYRSGYYDEMVDLIRGMLGRALKTNESLYFSVLTGCLRISKESIFSGFNNFSVYTVKDTRYNEYFGFTDAEVQKMLVYYGFTGQYSLICEWYDGYRFGSLNIYCPWDVVNYCDGLRDGSVTKPQNYWVNTSSNDIIRRFVSQANSATREEIEQLIGGGSVNKSVRQELTYRDLESGMKTCGVFYLPPVI